MLEIRIFKVEEMQPDIFTVSDEFKILEEEIEKYNIGIIVVRKVLEENSGL